MLHNRRRNPRNWQRYVLSGIGIEINRETRYNGGMTSPPAIAPSDSQPTAPHAHHWRIDEQGEAGSIGHCPCGEERLFQNGWDGDSGHRLRSGGWLAANRARKGTTEF
jgi:hypothetical protein